jgi:hypothetical protein
VSGTKVGAACAGVLPRKDSVGCPGHPDAQVHFTRPKRTAVHLVLRLLRSWLIQLDTSYTIVDLLCLLGKRFFE